jgi:GDP-L-fucose synthase
MGALPGGGHEAARPVNPSAAAPLAPETRVYVAGHTGLVGSALVRALLREGHHNLILRSHAELDLTDGAATGAFFAAERPELVMMAAARVGGILANRQNPYEFIQENLAMALNVIDHAFRSGVRRLLFLGSSCIFPKHAPQPLKEEYLLGGPLEETNRPYAVAKIAGIELCRSLNRAYGTDYLALMPTNLYGPGDNFDLETSHVVPALIRKFHEAKLAQQRGRPAPVTLWGSGQPRRELLHVDDLAEAVLFLAERTWGEEFADAMVNVGTGKDLTIRELADLIARVVGYSGEVEWDRTKPDGTPQKLLDVSRLARLGWTPSRGLEEGLRSTYRWYLEHPGSALEQ